MCQTVHYNPENRIAFIFAAPGQEEENVNCPAAGMTGTNLDYVISYLHQERSDIFPELFRYYYRITNSTSNIYYSERNGKTEPPKEEVENEINVQRVINEINRMDIVLFMGSKAKLLINKLNENNITGTFVESEHLSLQHLNTKIKEDINGNLIIRGGGASNTQLRLDFIAAKILPQLPAALEDDTIR